MDWLMFSLVCLTVIDMLFLVWGLVLSTRLSKLDNREKADFVILALAKVAKVTDKPAKKKAAKKTTKKTTKKGDK